MYDEIDQNSEKNIFYLNEYIFQKEKHFAERKKVLTLYLCYDISILSNINKLSKNEVIFLNKDTITCSFTMDRNVYNIFKSIVARHGENVKGNLVRYMQDVILYDTPNSDTILAIQEVQQLKKDQNKRIYKSFSEVLEELDNDE